ncbi:MAG: hypothetical protein ACI4PO_09505 [Faecousia sp.]
MKRKVLAVAAAMLLLCGCGQNEAPEETTEAYSTEIPCLYDPGHAITEQTGGAVKVYLLKRDGYTDMTFLGERLLLFREGYTEVYQGESLSPALTIQDLPATLQEMDSGIAWFDESSREVVFLNDRFVEQSRLRIPEDQVGDVYIAPDGHTVYYCTDTAVRALDLDSGISRLIYEGSAAQRTILKGLFDGRMLLCEMDGRQVLLSSKDGEVLGQQSFLNTLQTLEDRFYVNAETEAGSLLVYGERRGDLLALRTDMECVSVPQMQGALGMVQENGGVALSYFDLESGRKTAYIEIAGISEIRNVAADPDGKALWLHTIDSVSGSELLCRWELQKSAVTEDRVYTDSYYTREHPDRKNQLIQELRAEKLGEDWGLEILLWDEALTAVPQRYSFVDAYRTEDTQRAVDALEKVLFFFPEDFFVKAAIPTESGRIHILLLDSIRTQDPALRSGEQGLQYWQDGEMYIALAVNEKFEENLLHQIGHVIDSRILSICQALDDWNQLNPPWFSYDNDYLKNLERQDDGLLQGDGRAFIDFFSMSFAVEDRSTIFAYACMEGNEEYFRSAIMRSKLETLCRGIREAFGLQGDTGTYLWEQYL